MVLDNGNPLVSNLNSGGVNVKSDETISLLLHTVAGPANQCTLIVSFTPKNALDYRIRLLGELNFRRNNCIAKLFVFDKNGAIVNPKEFERHIICNS